MARSRIGTKEREISHPLFLSLPIAAALNPINVIALPRRRSARAVRRQMSQCLPPYFYAIFTPLSVRVSEDLGTAYKP